MQLTDKIFKGLYRRGVMLEQMKEPALARTVKQMEPAEPCENPPRNREKYFHRIYFAKHTRNFSLKD